MGRAREGFGKESYGKFSGIVMNSGDEMLFVTPSGGGYGDPLEREPELVLNDVAEELISAQTAHDVYGVVIVDGRVDGQATATLRTGQEA